MDRDIMEKQSKIKPLPRTYSRQKCQDNGGVDLILLELKYYCGEIELEEFYLEYSFRRWEITIAF